MRHIYAYLAGEKLDPESGESHLAHALCSVRFAHAAELRGRSDVADVPAITRGGQFWYRAAYGPGEVVLGETHYMSRDLDKVRSVAQEEQRAIFKLFGESGEHVRFWEIHSFEDYRVEA